MTKHKFDPTDEQLAIIDVMKQRSGSLMVTAFAGCAKTTTLELAAEQVKVPAMALAFNKKIAVDMQEKLPSNFVVKTFNGLGHQAWARVIPASKINLEDRKIGKLVTQISKGRKIDLNGDQWDDVRRMVSAAMQCGLVPRVSGPEGFVPDTLESWADIGAELGIWADEVEFVTDLARQVLEESIALAKAGTICFDDQIYCSVMLGGKFPQYPVVFADEAQDLNMLNHVMFGRVGRPDGRVAIVGDPCQSIYAFRGATSDSMGKMKGLRPNDAWIDRPLATTFRCPKVVVQRQQGHVPGYRAWHTNPDGVFTRLTPRLESPGPAPTWGASDLLGLRPDGKGTIAVLCRNNGPLLSLAFKLIRNGVGVTMLGRDIGKGLIALSRKLAPEDGTPADQVRAAIASWEQNETSLAVANDKPERVAGIVDRAECLHAVLDSAEARDAGQLRNLLERLFANERGLVVLGSIHRAKGLEWDVVVHLDPWRIPSKQAKVASANGDDRPMEQEMNLRYVAETRTKHTLATADLEAFV